MDEVLKDVVARVGAERALRGAVKHGVVITTAGCFHFSITHQKVIMN